MDFIWVFIAFACGFTAKQINLPPLVGYLFAGFALHAAGIKPYAGLESLANLGITLMLFTIGLKINFKTLLNPAIWAGTSMHMLIWVIIGASLLKLFSLSGLHFFTTLNLQNIFLISFALSFSSTVCVVKLLEDKGEMKARHGKLAVGILIMQDIIAVFFMVAATGKLPSVYALGLIALWPARHWIGKLLDHAGHGELLPLTGFLFALGGYELFSLVNLKGDLGALIAGLLLSQHSKSAELSKSLLSLKDLFLIGFFLSIGFTALPSVEMAIPVLAISGILIIKGILLFLALGWMKVPGRSMFLSSLLLANYSEFGLIVISLCVDQHWLPKEWLVISALAVTLSFMFTSILYDHAHSTYARMRAWVKTFERPQPEPAYKQRLAQAEVLIVGMGRVGRSSYDVIKQRLGNRVWGVELDVDKVRLHESEGRNIILGDAEDADFWATAELNHIKLIMLAMPSVNDIRDITAQLKNNHYNGHIVAIARYEDDRQQLLDYGVDNVFNYYVEAGTGFAEESLNLIHRSADLEFG